MINQLLDPVAIAAEIEEKYLLAELVKLLPSYMIPGRIIIETELPKNANGKVDRQKLQASLVTKNE